MMQMFTDGLKTGEKILVAGGMVTAMTVDRGDRDVGVIEATNARDRQDRTA